MKISKRLLGSVALAVMAATAMPGPVTVAKAAGNIEAKGPHEPARNFAGAYLAATAARTDNDFSAAALYLEEALSFDPENEDLKRELLLTLVTSGQFDEALPLADEMKDLPDIERVARLSLGIDELRKGEFDKATAMLNFTEANDLEVLMTGIMRGWATAGAGNAKAALEQIDSLKGPDWFALFQSYHTGLIAAWAGMEDEALRRYDEGINNATGGNASPLTYLRLSEAYARLLAATGDTAKAGEIIERGLATAPTNPALTALQGEIANGTVDAAFVSTPAHGAGEILLDLASAINRDGAETFVRIYLELARAAWPDNAQTLVDLGLVTERLGNVPDAIDYYASVSEASPLHRVAALQQGLALSDLDRNDEAKTTLRALIDEAPDDYRGYMALGGVHSFLKEFDEAAKVYEEALTHIDGNDPSFWTVHYRLGIAYERTGAFPKAEATFLKALELSPDQPDILNYLGYSWVDMNLNLEKGLEMIEKAVSMRPRDGYIVDSLGWAFYRLGRFEEAVEQLERAADLRPRDPTINDHLGDAYWRVGRKLEAAYQWSQALEMEGDDVDRDMVRQKLAAANAIGMEPQIAEAISDTAAGENKAAGEPKADGQTAQ